VIVASLHRDQCWSSIEIGIKTTTVYDSDNFQVQGIMLLGFGSIGFGY